MERTDVCAHACVCFDSFTCSFIRVVNKYIEWLPFLKIFLTFIHFERQRETECKLEWGRERGRHRIQSRLQALSGQHRARRGARTRGPRDRDLSQSRTPNRPSHPGAPLRLFRASCPSLSFRVRGSGTFLPLGNRRAREASWPLPAADVAPPGHTEEGHNVCSITSLISSFPYTSAENCPEPPNLPDACLKYSGPGVSLEETTF